MLFSLSAASSIIDRTNSRRHLRVPHLAYVDPAPGAAHLHSQRAPRQARLRLWGAQHPVTAPPSCCSPTGCTHSTAALPSGATLRRCCLPLHRRAWRCKHRADDELVGLWRFAAKQRLAPEGVGVAALAALPPACRHTTTRAASSRSTSKARWRATCRVCPGVCATLLFVVANPMHFA